MSRRRAACVFSFVVLGAFAQQPSSLAQFAAAFQVASVPVFVIRDLSQRVKRSIQERRQRSRSSL